MISRLGAIIFFICIGVNADSQHLIGLSKNEVIQKMQETNFVIDNSSRNATFKYLKYVDKVEEKTLLVFLSKDDICTSTKLMSDYSSYRSTMNDFNKKFTKISSTEWNYNVDSTVYKVVLKKEEWFFSVIVTTKN